MKKAVIICFSIIFMGIPLFANELSEIYTFESGSYPRGVEIADINSDGSNEVIVSNFGEDTLIGQENDVEPTSSIAVFTKAGPLNFLADRMNAGKSPRGLATGDTNGDRMEDFVVTNYDDGTITIFEQADGGSFNSEVIEVGRHPVGVALGDIDSSGNVKGDIAVSVYSESKVVILLRDSHGRWEKKDIPLPGSPTDVVMGTINGEKVLVSANYAAGNISIIKKSGGEIVKTQDIKVGGGPCKVEIGDVTGDKVNDIVVANFYDNTISVIEYKNETASEPVTYKLAGSRPNGMCLGDVNGDGLLDVVAADRDSDSIDILTQQNGMLALTQSIQVTEDEDKTYGPVEIKCGDLNGDGFDDIAFSHMRTNTLRVIFQIPDVPEEAPKVTEPISEKNTYNYPNPAKDSTTIRFSLSEPTDVKIIIYDPEGRMLWHRELSEAEVSRGINKVIWQLITDSGQPVANGVYIYKVITGDTVITKKIVVIK